MTLPRLFMFSKSFSLTNQTQFVIYTTKIPNGHAGNVDIYFAVIVHYFKIDNYFKYRFISVRCWLPLSLYGQMNLLLWRAFVQDDCCDWIAGLNRHDYHRARYWEFRRPLQIYGVCESRMKCLFMHFYLQKPSGRAITEKTESEDEIVSDRPNLACLVSIQVREWSGFFQNSFGGQF